jgi:hypothetical protein
VVLVVVLVFLGLNLEGVPLLPLVYVELVLVLVVVFLMEYLEGARFR